MVNELQQAILFARRKPTFALAAFCFMMAAAFQLGSCDKITEPPPNDVEYYVYVASYTQYVSKVYKIDATSDSLVDSVEYTHALLDLFCSPDGRELWGVGSDKTVIWNTSDFSIKHTFDTLGYIEPVWNEKGELILAVGLYRIYYLDNASYLLLDVDTTAGYQEFVHLPEEKALLGADTRRFENNIYLGMMKYSYETRGYVDSVELTDSEGKLAYVSICLDPKRDKILGISAGCPFARWYVFDPATGNSSYQSSNNSNGDFIFVDEGRKFILTDPGDCRDVCGLAGMLPLFDASTYTQMATLDLKGHLEPEQPYAFSLASEHGVGIPDGNKAYITCSGGCRTGPVAVVSIEPFEINRFFFLKQEMAFFSITIGKK